VALSLDLLLRIGVGTGLGGIIGYERDRHGRPAGLRTHMLVALASSTFMVISTHFVYFQHYVREDLVSVDTSRIGASIVTGIGFLAGGAILRTGLSVQGLTTAAGLWLVAAIGMSSGAGMYSVSAFVTVVGVVALTTLRRLEDKDVVRRTVSLVLAPEGSVGEVLSKLRELEAAISTVRYEERVPEKRTRVTLDIRLPQRVGDDKLLEVLGALAGMQRIRIDHTR
jgi:putative Mg2+ transporter-C (MgtC) family protein